MIGIPTSQQRFIISGRGRVGQIDLGWVGWQQPGVAPCENAHMAFSAIATCPNIAYRCIMHIFQKMVTKCSDIHGDCHPFHVHCTFSENINKVTGSRLVTRTVWSSQSQFIHAVLNNGNYPM